MSDVLQCLRLPMHCLQRFHNSTILHRVQFFHWLYDTSLSQKTACMHQTHSHLLYAKNNRSSLLYRLLFLVLASPNRSCRLRMHVSTRYLSEKSILYPVPMATRHCSNSSMG